MNVNFENSPKTMELYIVYGVVSIFFEFSKKIDAQSFIPSTVSSWRRAFREQHADRSGRGAGPAPPPRLRRRRGARPASPAAAAAGAAHELAQRRGGAVLWVGLTARRCWCAWCKEPPAEQPFRAPGSDCCYRAHARVLVGGREHNLQHVQEQVIIR